MLLETYGVYECQVGVEDFLWGMTIEGSDKKTDDATCYDCIAVSAEIKLSVAEFTTEPYSALTSADEVVLGFVAFIYLGAFFAEVNEVGVSVEPFVEVGELVDDLLFCFFYCHYYFGAL